MATKRTARQPEPFPKITMPRIMDAARVEGVIVKEVVFYPLATTLKVIGTVHQIIPFAAALSVEATRYELVPEYKHDSKQPVYLVSICVKTAEAE